MASYKHVIFDMDGVLINSIDLWIKVGIAGLEELKITNISRMDMIKGVVKFETLQKIGVTDLRSYGMRINEMFAERILEIEPQEHIIDLLESLKQKRITMAVVTTSGKKAVHGIFKNLGLEKYFETIITYDDVEKHKPDPEGVFKAMKTLKAKPENTLIVGDTRNDILAGKAAGITTVMYYPQCHSDIYDRDHLLGLSADYYVCDLRDVEDIIR